MGNGDPLDITAHYDAAALQRTIFIDELPAMAR
jgi:hypothetical protein